MKELIELVGDLQERRVEFKSLRESLDTITPGGELIFHVFASIAEFERDIIGERTMAELEAARARGRKGGRKPVMDQKKVAFASAKFPWASSPRRKTATAAHAPSACPGVA